MSTEKQILGIIPGLQATSLVATNIPRRFPMKQKKKINYKKGTKRMVNLGVRNILGIGLITPTAKMINDLP